MRAQRQVIGLTLVKIVAVLMSGTALAQNVWIDPGTSQINATAIGRWDDLAAPIDCLPLCPQSNPPGPLPLTVGPIVNMRPGYKGRDFGNGAVVSLGDQGCCFTNTIYAGAGAHLSGWGLGTELFTVRWKAVAEPDLNFERISYDAFGEARLNGTVRVAVSTNPPGQQVTVYFSWWGWVGTVQEAENGIDDLASIQNVRLQLDNTDLIAPGTADFANTTVGLRLPRNPATGFILAQDGDVISVRVSANAFAQISDPGNPPTKPGIWEDHADAVFRGELYLSIDQPLPPIPRPGAPGYREWVDFSLDIGSDAEMSDPIADGNETFDPGDAYLWNRSGLAQMPPGGLDGHRDDALIFGVDYWPQAPDGPLPATGAQTCAGANPVALLEDRFDLDGSDALDVSLRLIVPPGQPLAAPLAWQPSTCIHPAESLLVSFDDDWIAHYAAAVCDVPVGALSATGARYGMTRKRDEVVAYDLNPVWPPPLLGPYSGPGWRLAVLDETQLHADLAGNPDANDDTDDDVDALDAGDVMNPATDCAYWYFSADHEATGSYLPGGALNGGDVYEVLPLGGHVKVLDHAVHLGLADGVDLDALEFAWLDHCRDPIDATTCAPALALLFSVDDNDYTVPGDESGGLDPNMIYASFMTGYSFPLLTTPLRDDIDALAVAPRPVLPFNCVGGQQTWWQERFEAYPVGQVIAGLGGWENWIMPPSVDGVVSGLRFLMGMQSLHVPASAEASRPFFDADSGAWTLVVRTFIPGGSTGFGRLALWNQYVPGGPPPPPGLSVDLIFDANNQTVYDTFGGSSTPLQLGAWVEVTADIDLIRDEVSVYYDGNLVTRRSWTQGVGQPRFAALSIGGLSLTDGIFVDDLVLEGDRDCDASGTLDGCDIATGAAADCQGDGSIDECEIASGVSADCNANQVPDVCDADCNANGTPDDCESTRYPDFDGDGVVGGSDYGMFQGCFTGPCGAPPCAPALYSGACCVLGDRDGDGDVDLIDFAYFQTAYTGP